MKIYATVARMERRVIKVEVEVPDDASESQIEDAAILATSDKGFDNAFSSDVEILVEMWSKDKDDDGEWDLAYFDDVEKEAN